MSPVSSVMTILSAFVLADSNGWPFVVVAFHTAVLLPLSYNTPPGVPSSGNVITFSPVFSVLPICTNLLFLSCLIRVPAPIEITLPVTESLSVSVWIDPSFVTVKVAGHSIPKPLLALFPVAFVNSCVNFKIGSSWVASLSNQILTSFKVPVLISLPLLLTIVSATLFSLYDIQELVSPLDVNNLFGSVFLGKLK